MGREIERKFLVTGDAWRRDARGARCVQGYLAGARGECGVRVRRMEDKGFLTLKGPDHAGVRAEYEYLIPLGDADELLDRFCLKPLIEKTRYRILHRRHTWDVDVFHGANTGLVLAEVELNAIDEPIEVPDWIGEEVTGRPAYHNFSLVRRPFTTWNHS